MTINSQGVEKNSLTNKIRNPLALGAKYSFEVLKTECHLCNTHLKTRSGACDSALFFFSVQDP